MTRILVLGGSSNFGARIVRALQREPTMQVLCAARRGTPIPGAPQVCILPIDICAPDLTARLRELAPALVIHCAGPFQGQDYSVRGRPSRRALTIWILLTAGHSLQDLARSLMSWRDRRGWWPLPG